MDLHITGWVTEPALVPREFELATYQFEYHMTTWPSEPFVILSTACDKVTEKGREAFQELVKGGRTISKLRRPLNVAFTAYELEPANIFFSTFPL